MEWHRQHTHVAVNEIHIDLSIKWKWCINAVNLKLGSLILKIIALITAVSIGGMAEHNTNAKIDIFGVVKGYPKNDGFFFTISRSGMNCLWGANICTS